MFALAEAVEAFAFAADAVAEEITVEFIATPALGRLVAAVVGLIVVGLVGVVGDEGFAVVVVAAAVEAGGVRELEEVGEAGAAVLFRFDLLFKKNRLILF